MSDTTRFAVIMAGGSGERFWPLSRAARPKQLLHLTDPDRSMLAEAVERLLPVVPRERIYVITSRALLGPIAAAGLGLPDGNLVGEPCKRNTTGALAWITAHILAQHPSLTPEQVSLAIVTADHRIGAPASFCAMIDTALGAAEGEGALVVCGIPPDAPETGFGYIQAAAPLAARPGVAQVHAFHEKPNRERAEDFLAAGHYFWNSGMFFWTAQAFLGELDHARPVVATAVRAMHAAQTRGDVAQAEALFAGLEDISIDYALMEHAQKVLMVQGGFPWADVGSWSSIAPVLPKDGQENAVQGDVVLYDCQGCIVYNDAALKGMTVGVAGASDLVVVVTPDAVLVVPKDRAQDVRHLVAQLKQRGAPQI